MDPSLLFVFEDDKARLREVYYELADLQDFLSICECPDDGKGRMDPWLAILQATQRCQLYIQQSLASYVPHVDEGS